jgi:mono/diheme cytochrome c family protein
MQRLGIVGLTLFLAALAAALPAKPPQNHNGQIERGRYLVENVAMCIECHTPRDARGGLDRTKLLQGAPIPVRAPFLDQQWAFQAPNISGLPGWTTPDAVRLLETGRRASGRSPKPPMPTYKMTRADAGAVVAYLLSLR